MADKKITALQEMNAADVQASEDLLHIIDFGGGSSPVNKRITVANLFSKVNTSTEIYAASKQFEIGLSDSTVSVLKAFTGANDAAASGVMINEDKNALCDFTVKTNNSDQAIFVDSSDDSGNGNVNYVKINGDSGAVDFQVYSDTGILIHTDAPNHSVGIGTTSPSASYMVDVAADGDTGASAGLAGWLGFTGTPDNLTGGATGNKTVIPVTTAISHLTAADTTNGHFSLADGTEGQVKILVAKTISSGEARVTPTNYGTGSGAGAYILFNAMGESVTLLFTNGRWNAIGYGRGVDQG
tara:strand:- start:799 stop:1692 length:894 start_codon:yes stop_codon:yes gene_type:complete